jgi:hypothetical protein
VHLADALPADINVCMADGVGDPKLNRVFTEERISTTSSASEAVSATEGEGAAPYVGRGGRARVLRDEDP